MEYFILCAQMTDKNFRFYYSSGLCSVYYFCPLQENYCFTTFAPAATWNKLVNSSSTASETVLLGTVSFIWFRIAVRYKGDFVILPLLQSSPTSKRILLIKTMQGQYLYRYLQQRKTNTINYTAELKYLLTQPTHSKRRGSLQLKVAWPRRANSFSPQIGHFTAKRLGSAYIFQLIRISMIHRRWCEQRASNWSQVKCCLSLWERTVS